MYGPLLGSDRHFKGRQWPVALRSSSWCWPSVRQITHISSFASFVALIFEAKPHPSSELRQDGDKKWAPSTLGFSICSRWLPDRLQPGAPVLRPKSPHCIVSWAWLTALETSQPSVSGGPGLPNSLLFPSRERNSIFELLPNGWGSSICWQTHLMMPQASEHCQLHDTRSLAWLPPTSPPPPLHMHMYTHTRLIKVIMAETIR